MSYAEVQKMSIEELEMVIRHSSIYCEIYHFAVERLTELRKEVETALLVARSRFHMLSIDL